MARASTAESTRTHSFSTKQFTKNTVCELKTSLTTSNNNTNSKYSRRDTATNTAKTSHKPRVSSSKPARRPKFLLSKTRRRRRDFTFTRRVRIRPTPLNNCDERSEHVHRQFMDEYFELVVVVGGARVVVPPLSHSRARYFLAGSAAAASQTLAQLAG